MTVLESNKVVTGRSAADLFQFLSDFNNYKPVMPEQVVDWQSTIDECSFSIKGMASLGMKMVENTPNSLIKIQRYGKAPFDFTLLCKIEESGEQSELQLIMEADLNPMLKMMASKPLTNFLNLLVNKISEI